MKKLIFWTVLLGALSFPHGSLSLSIRVFSHPPPELNRLVLLGEKFRRVAITGDCKKIPDLQNIYGQILIEISRLEEFKDGENRPAFMATVIREYDNADVTLSKTKLWCRPLASLPVS